MKSLCNIYAIIAVQKYIDIKYLVI